MMAANQTDASLRRRSIAFSIAVAAVIGAGCTDTPSLAKVRGRVTLNGVPLKSGTVYTSPLTGKGAKGVIDSDGYFELGTYSKNDGAVIGNHKVGVLAVDTAGTGPEGETKLLVPKRYASADTSQLTIEIKGSGENTPEIVLISR